MKKFYIVIVEDKKSHLQVVSQEGYKTLEEAVQFILERFDNPEHVDGWIFESNTSLYFIKEILVR